MERFERIATEETVNSYGLFANNAVTEQELYIYMLPISDI